MLQKVLCALAVIIGVATGASAQNKIVKHCYITAQYGAFSKTKFKITLQKGNVDSLFSFMDTSLVKQLLVVEKTETLSDAMNFMEMHGWKLSTVVFSEMYSLHELFFERIFDLSEIRSK